MGSQGDAGQFRTPRHIIDFIVQCVDPQKNDTILDPACGTAGFLIAAYKHILNENIDLKTKRPGGALSNTERNKLSKNFVGYDISHDMVRLSLVNMYLHHFADPRIFEYDTLTSLDRWDDSFDCILANPPFMTPKGGIRPHNRFSIKAKRSEVLFVDYIAEHLNPNGKAGIIVPEGIIFQSGTAYKNLRKILVEDNYLYAVVSLPAGVFNPYSGVKTSILLLDRNIAKQTDGILFVKVENDGFDLGAQRRPREKNDLQDSMEFIINSKSAMVKRSIDNSFLNEKCSFVKKDQISKSGDYNLSGDRYKEEKVKVNGKWPNVVFSEVCKLGRGFAFKSEDYVSKGILNFRVTNIGRNGLPDLSDCKYLPEKFLQEYKNYQLKDNDFVIVMVGATVGKIGLITKGILPALLNQNMWRFSPDESKLNKKFLYYLVHQAPIIAQGGAQGYLKQSDFNKLKIPLPSLDDQLEIAAELDGYQNIINGAKQVIENYKPLIKIDPSWDEIDIGDVCDLETGGTPSSKRKDYYDGGDIKWLVSGDIHKGEILDCPKRITALGMKESNARYLPANSVLIALNGQGKTRGTVAILRTKATCNQSLVSINPKDHSKLRPEFLYYELRSKYQQIRNLTGDNQRSGLNMPIIRRIKVHIPPVNLQDQIINENQELQKIVDSNLTLTCRYRQRITDKIKEVWGE